MTIKGFSSTKKTVPPIAGADKTRPTQEFATLSPVSDLGRALDTAPKGFKPLTAVALTLDASQPTERPDRQLILTGHGARKGDVVRFTSGNLIDMEAAILSAPDANTLILDTVLPEAPVGGTDTVQIFRGASVTLSSTGALQTTSGPNEYVLDGASQQVTEDTATPANNRFLPVDSSFVKDGIDTKVLKDTATPANSAPLPTEVLGVDGVARDVSTEAKQDDTITQLVAINVDTDTIITELQAINTDTDTLVADLAKLEGRLAGDLVPELFDFLALSYVAAGNGAGEIETVTYRTGGAAGSIVKTLTLGYDASNRLISVTAA